VLDVVCNHSSPEHNGGKGVVLHQGKPLADIQNDIKSSYHYYPEITI
jgi:cyclomaltodextrin glucanotransferase